MLSLADKDPLHSSTHNAPMWHSLARAAEPSAIQSLSHVWHPCVTMWPNLTLRYTTSPHTHTCTSAQILVHLYHTHQDPMYMNKLLIDCLIDYQVQLVGMTVVSVILMVMMKTMMTIVVIRNNNCIYSVKFQCFAQQWQLVNSFWDC